MLVAEIKVDEMFDRVSQKRPREAIMRKENQRLERTCQINYTCIIGIPEKRTKKGERLSMKYCF